MTVRILIGDVRERLAELPDESVHCVVTSPPYFGLRDYGTAQWDGGDPDCDHQQERTPRTERPAGALTGSTAYVAAQEPTYRHTCGKCGATRIDNQIGLEPTLAEYIDTMTAVFREVRRVLRSDGVCWLNIGDSYAGGGGFSANAPTTATSKSGQYGSLGGLKAGGVKPEGLIKAKDLMMVPARLALALQADGWWLRSDIIWHKPNPMPESVTDRPTNAHEHIFLLTKSARYWYDADAVRTEALSEYTKMPDGWNTGPGAHGSFHPNGREKGAKVDKQRGHGRRHAGFNDRWDAAEQSGQLANGANLRNVWSISTVGFPGAHFATFPPEIPRRCIKAGCPEGGTVLDPFFGSGTTGMVADQLGRHCIGIELSPEYAALAKKRIYDSAPLLVEITA